MNSKRPRITAENTENIFTSLKGLMAPLDEEPEPPQSPVMEVELGRIRPNPDQPRRSSSSGFSKASIQDLAENIREHGLLQPLLVKDTGRFYQIIAGERRFRACQSLGMERVPVLVVEPKDDQDELQIALAENLQRKNLGPMEEAYAFRTLIERYGLSYRDLARLAGRSTAHVHGRLQLLQYDDVRLAVEEKRIGIADGIQLARVPDEAARKELLAAAQDGSVRGAALHRQVQVFLGEITSEDAGAGQPGEQPKPPPATLEDAVAVVNSLDEDLPEEERTALYTLASRAAERLGLELNVPPLPAVAEEEPAQPRAPEPMGPELRRVVARAKEHRDSRGYTLVNLIRVYWMQMGRRGYTFTPGEWRAESAGDGRFLVTFSYKVDGEQRLMEWICEADNSMMPSNEEARALTE